MTVTIDLAAIKSRQRKTWASGDYAMIGLVNHTPESFVGQVFRTNARHVPAPVGLRSPVAWGAKEYLRGLLGDGVREIRLERGRYTFRYASPEAYLDHWRRWYGPTIRTFAALDEAGQTALAADLLDVARAHNRSGDSTMVVPSEYLEVVAVRA